MRIPRLRVTSVAARGGGRAGSRMDQPVHRCLGGLGRVSWEFGCPGNSGVLGIRVSWEFGCPGNSGVLGIQVSWRLGPGLLKALRPGALEAQAGQAWSPVTAPR